MKGRIIADMLNGKIRYDEIICPSDPALSKELNLFHGFLVDELLEDKRVFGFKI